MIKKDNILSDQIRDLIHNLDISKSENFDIFWDMTKQTIASHESMILEAYDDNPNSGANLIRIRIAENLPINGKITIGIGFNMDREGAKAEWQKILGDSVCFDDAKAGRIKLTKDQAMKLFDYSLKIRYKELKNYYIGEFTKLKANEQMAILSAYYNAPSLVAFKLNILKEKVSTRFRTHMLNYIKTGKKESLLDAVNELGVKSNPAWNAPGLIIRRQFESNLLNSTKSPFYAKPGQKLPATLPNVILGKTIIPIGIKEHLSGKVNPNYYIWRSSEDDKVRAEHRTLNGLVLKYNSGKEPGQDFNCRCYAEPLPLELNVIDQKQTLAYFLRYGAKFIL